MGRESLLGLATHEQTHELVGGRKTKKKKRTFSLYICKSTGRWEIRWETSRCDLLLEIWANDGHQMLLRPKKWTHNRLTKISTDPTTTDRFFFVGWLLRVLFFRCRRKLWLRLHNVPLTHFWFRYQQCASVVGKITAKWILRTHSAPKCCRFGVFLSFPFKKRKFLWKGFR